LLDYVIFAALLFYILTIGGLFVFRKKYPDMQLPYRTAFYPYLPALYCLTATFIAINLLIYKPAYTWSGLLIVLSGIPVYFLKKYFEKIKIKKDQK
jgi:basic amino acid/polyamine antiporter, APA family